MLYQVVFDCKTKFSNHSLILIILFSLYYFPSIKCFKLINLTEKSFVIFCTWTDKHVKELLLYYICCICWLSLSQVWLDFSGQWVYCFTIWNLSTWSTDLPAPRPTSSQRTRFKLTKYKLSPSTWSNQNLNSNQRENKCYVHWKIQSKP